MVQSMTAFARKEKHSDYGSLVWEIKTVNHRYLEIGFRLPETLSGLEHKLRDKLRTQLQRGKVDCTLRFQPRVGNQVNLQINTALTEALTNAASQIMEKAAFTPPLTIGDLLRWPGVVQLAESPLTSLQAEVEALFNETLKEVVQYRQSEGESLVNFILQRVHAIYVELQKISDRLPNLMLSQRQKMLMRFGELIAQVEQTRLEQELLFFAQKIDIAEEIERLNIHLQEIERCVKAGGLIGRRLDFLIQELHREANTLGSKIPDINVVQAVVEMKVLIEQLREQAQNVE